ncbi:MAG: hypothetical protein EXS15_00515 [Phycisphaerales bacterium]|nr:hypothetical protein [Phycisphaerales bacterium]
MATLTHNSRWWIPVVTPLATSCAAACVTVFFPLCLVGCMFAAGCGVGAVGRLEVTSMGDSPRTLVTDLGVSTYALELANTSFMMSDITQETLQDSTSIYGHVLHVELLWVPKAGHTAVDPAATNTSIRLVVFSGKEIGVYGGGGFAWPTGEPGEPQYGLDIVGSNVSLLAATSGFIDLLSPAQLTGRLTSRLDDAKTRQMRRATSQCVTNALKRVQWVGPMSGDLQERARSPMDGSSIDDVVFR